MQLTGLVSRPNISEVFADAAIDFIRRKPPKPFFLHVNFTAPHDPLFLPPGYEGRYKPETIPVPPNLRPNHHSLHPAYLPCPRSRARPVFAGTP